jgi:hypothetical protein
MNTFLTLATGGGLVALGGLASGFVTNWLGAKRDQRRYDHEQDMARASRSHEQDMAREARSQERLDRAYIALGEYLSRFGDWARSVRPFTGPVPAPAPQPPEEQWHIEALVTAYGSEEVRLLLEQWRKRARIIENADLVIRSAEQSPDLSAELDEKALRERQALEDYRKAMHDAADAIRGQMRQELDRSGSPPATPGA